MADSGQLMAQGLGALLYFDWWVVSYSQENNTTTIEWQLKLSSVLTNTISKTSSNYVNIDGVEHAYHIPAGTYKSSTDYVINGGTDVIKHNADGTKTISVSIWQNGTFTTFGTMSASSTFELNALKRNAAITSAPNFTDEDSPIIRYDNPAGVNATSLQACISFTGANDDIAYRDIPKGSSGSYTFYLTDDEISILRQAVKSGNSISVRFYIKSVVDSITYWDYVTKTFTIAHPEPTIAPTVKDINTRAIELTGDNTKFIKYFSNAYVTAGAAAVDGATLVSLQLINGSFSQEIGNTAAVYGVDSNTFYFSATDSRGYTTRDALVVDLVPYVKLTNNLVVDSFTALGALTFTVKGKYYSGSFGAQDNTMEVELALVDSNGNFIFAESGEDSGWRKLGTVSPRVDNNSNYSYSYTITGLDYEENYTLTVNVIDATGSVMQSSLAISPTPIFDWDKNDFRHNTDVYFNRDVYINEESIGEFVVNQDSNGTWFYRKWNSGRVELYGYQNINNIACTSTLGGWYRTAVQSAPDFPFTVYNPKTVVNYESNGYGALVWLTTRATEYSPADYYLIRPTSSAGITGVVYYYVTGTWK